MRATSLVHLSNGALIGATRNLATTDRATTADLVWHLAEIDRRRLYLEHGHPSMKEFCREALGMTEDVALKRIRVLRIVRRFPQILDMLADGRLSLTAVIQLRPHLRRENVAEVLVAAARRSSAEIERMLAERFPRSEMLALVEVLPVTEMFVRPLADVTNEVAARPLVRAANADEVAARPLATAVSRVEPVAVRRFALHVMMSGTTNDKLEYLEELLGHQIPSGEVAEIVDRAFDALIEKMEKAKLGASGRPQKKPRPTRSARHIPAHVRRVVWSRDGGQCTFVSEDGRRCSSRAGLEFDHVQPVAHGGVATVENLRLCCRGHNQYIAERTFGSGFMERKREHARGGRAATCDTSPDPALVAGQVACNVEPASAAAAECEASARAAVCVEQVIPWLRALGIRADLARRAAEACAEMTDAPIEERVKRALQYCGPRPRAIPG